MVHGMEEMLIRVFLIISGILSMLLFSWQMKQRRPFWLRLVGFAAFYTGVDFLSGTISAALMASGSANSALLILLHSLYNIAAFLLLSASLCFLYEESFVTMLFCGVSGKCTMHIAEYLSKIVFHFTFMSTLLSVCVYAVVYLAVFLLFARKLNREECSYLDNAKVVFFAFVAMAATDVLVLSFNTRQISSPANVYVFALVTLLCAMILVLQYSLLLESRHRTEAVVISQLRKKEREQYEISKEAISLIGIRQHDLKNMLESCGGNLLEPEIRELVKSLDDYDFPMHTGNKTLDVILMEKFLVCKNKNIRLECAVDGSALGFISDMDLYSLFLNALNNAVESADKLIQPEKREVQLKCYTRGSLLFIQVQNRFQELQRSPGGFLTTKADKDNHGFGLRSMRMIAEKYDGEMSVKTDGDMFCLGFAIPVPQ